MLSRTIAGALACAVGGALAVASPAPAAAPHTVQPGETLWSIAAANNLTTRTVAVYNGVTEDAQLVAGTTVHVPTVAEGAAALAAGAPTAGSTAAASTAGLGHVPSPYGELHLAPAAADAWNAMRADALSIYGTDISPGGPLAAYRSVDVETPEMRWVIDQIGAQYGWSKIHGPGEWWHVDYFGG
jgi:LysM repeat protein